VRVLLNLSQEIRECYEHAWRAHEKAEHATSPAVKQEYLDAEMRWLTLAHSYETVGANICLYWCSARRGIPAYK